MDGGRKLIGHCLGKADHGVLAGDVCHEAPVRSPADDGRDIDDVSVALRLHDGSDLLTEHQRARHIDVYIRHELFGGHGSELRQREHPGIVHQDVHCAVGFHSLFENDLRVILVGRVGDDVDGLAALGPDLLHYGLRALFIASGHDDLRTLFGEQIRRVSAHAGSGAGDDGYFPIKFTH